MEKPTRTFRTKTGTCTITETEILLTREGVRGGVSQAIYGDSIIRALVVRSVLGIGALAYGASLLASANHFRGSLFCVLGVFCFWNVIVNRKYSAAPVIEHSSIRDVQAHAPRPPMTRGYFTVYFGEQGRERKRLIMLASSVDGGGVEYLRAVTLMQKAGLLSDTDHLNDQADSWHISSTFARSLSKIGFRRMASNLRCRESNQMKVQSEIAWVADEVQLLLDAEYAAVGQPAAGSALDQLGLRDGASIVHDYLSHGEMGLAFEHLIYMIDEPGLELSCRAHSALIEAGEAMKLSPTLWADIRRSNVAPSDTEADRPTPNGQ